MIREEVTYAIAGRFGWMFEIPTQEKIAGGYLFNNEYINSDDAWEEILELYPEAKLGRNISFDAGSYEEVYMHNVLAVGLSAGFLEPLEATSLMTVAFQLENWGPGVSYKVYNEKIKRLNRENMLFIYFHYLGGRNDTGFWYDYQKNIPEDLRNQVEKDFPIWTCDKNGRCLTGDAGNSIHTVDEIREFYKKKYGSIEKFIEKLRIEREKFVKEIKEKSGN